MNFDDFFVRKGWEGVSKLEYVVSQRRYLCIGFNRVFSLGLLLFQVFPNFFYLFTRKSFRDGWGDPFNRVSFARVLITQCRVISKLTFDFMSEGSVVRSVEIIPSGFVNG